MLTKSLNLIITFQETTHALAAERFLTERNLPGRLIPVPRQISAGCGLSWKAPPNAEKAICAALLEAAISWQEIHVLEI